MKTLPWITAIVVTICLICSQATGQEWSKKDLEDSPKAVDIVEVEAQSPFHRNVIRAAIALNKKGELKRGQLMRLRICMLSPAFRKSAEELAITQMVFSGAESVPLDENGVVERSQIDWDALLEFLEKLVPIIIQIISIFG